MSRLAKQLLFGGIYLAIIAGILWWGFRLVVPGPTCTDGIQNGGEEGLDCGVVCGTACPVALQPLQNLPTQLVRYGNGSYDVVAHLENPNATFGAARVDYTLKVAGASGVVLASRRGITYVNPVQPRYLVFPLAGVSGVPASVSLQFTPADVQWGALKIDQAGTVQFAIRRERTVPTAGSFHYEATVTNRSNFAFDQVDVTVLLYNTAGALVGAGTTTLNTIIAGEERAFVVDWPFAIPGVARVQTEATTNIFDNANYIRAYGSQERFQGF